MGGCKCTFRNCPNTSAKSPNKHFFHFPAKDKIRCEKWILMSGNNHFRDYPDSKLKNQNVCEDHYKLHMFMNVKKERLTRFAYPSLLELSSGEIIDLEENNLYKLSWTVGYDLIEDDAVRIKGAIYTPEVTPQIVRNFTNPMVSAASESEDFLIEKAEDSEDFALPDEPETHKITISMLPTRANSKVGVKRPASKPPSSDIQVLTPVRIKKAKPSQVVKILSVDQVTTSRPIMPKPVPEPRVSQNEIASLTAKFEAGMAEKAAEFEAQLERYRSEIAGYQARISQLESQPAPSMKQENKPSLVMTPMTKPQLFIAIKRYLSSSMAVLLRMEMFGSNEREWKTDEKKLASEILSLGTDVYDHFLDEWRLRLPPKSDAHQWLNDGLLEDFEDL